MSGKRDWKADLRTLRERRGGVPEEVKESDRRRREILRRIRGVLDEGARTVPGIARAVELTTTETLFFVMALKKYGEVVEGEEREGWYEYARKEVSG